MPLRDLTRRRGGRWLAAVGLLISNFFLHKPVSDVCDALYARLGRRAYEWSTLLGIAALSAAGAALLLRGDMARLRGGGTMAALLGVAGLTIAAQQLLLVSNVELIHLPQFGLLAALMLATGLPPQLAWLAASAGGALDEGYQRVVIYAAVPNVYFDWNDIVLNSIGAAGAVLLMRGGRGDDATPGERRAQHLLLLATIAGLALAWGLAPPRVTIETAFPFVAPTLARALTGRYYHVMSASEGVLMLLLIWLLVRLGVGGARRNGAAPLGLALVLLVGGCGAHERVAAPAPPHALVAAPFFITFWCGPPLAELTDARAAEIAAAGFDVVGAPCEGFVSPQLNHRALDVAARHGLRLWITDPRVDQYHPATPDWADKLAAAVADYGSHPALGGYFLVDEPDAERFASLGAVVDRLRVLDPTRVAYINLLPDYAPAEALGTPTYREHVARYVAEVHPSMLSVDYYPFRENGDRDSFFANLGVIREQALAAGIPWMLIVQAMPHGPYRDPSAAELSWQVFNGLAFGARAISYFTYWTPVAVAHAERWHFRRGLIEGGVATDKLVQVARLNAEARAIAGALDGYASLAVACSSAEGSFHCATAPYPIRDVVGNALLGVFGAPHGARAVLVVNQDYRRAQRVRLNLAQPLATQRFDPARQVWELEYGRTVDVELPAGGAALLGWDAATAERKA